MPRSGRFTYRHKTPVPILQDAGWAPGLVQTRVDWRKILCFHRNSNPPTVQPAASRYTDCTIPSPNGTISQRRNAKYLNRCGRGIIACCNGYCVKELNKIPGNFRTVPYSVEIRSTQLSNTSGERCCTYPTYHEPGLFNG